MSAGALLKLIPLFLTKKAAKMRKTRGVWSNLRETGRLEDSLWSKYKT